MPQVEHTSFCSRLCSSFVGVLIGLLLLPVGVVVIFKNEANQVCSTKAFTDMSAQTVELKGKCTFDDSNNKRAVHLACPVLENRTVWATDAGTAITVRDALKIVATTEMWQWKEEKHSATKDDSVGGGQTATTCFCFHQAWSTSLTSLNSAHLQPGMVCGEGPADPASCVDSRPPYGARNPALRGADSTSGVGVFTSYSPKVSLGIGSVQFELTEQVPSIQGMRPLDAAVSDVQGWQRTGPRSFYQNAGLNGGFHATPQIGDRRLTLKLFTAESVSAVGAQSSVGGVGRLKAFAAGGSAVPPCDARRVQAYRAGIVDADAIFDDLQAEVDGITVVFRILAFVILWLGFSLIGGPLSVTPHLFPFIGSWLAGLTRCIVGAIAFLCALSWWSLFTALAYLFYKPLLGLVLLAAAAAAAFAAVKLRRKCGNAEALELGVGAQQPKVPYQEF